MSFRSRIPRPLRALYRRIRPRRGTVVADRIEGFGEIYVRIGFTDRAVLDQIFRDRQYDVSRYAQWQWVTDAYADILSRGRTPVVLDLGANIGASAVWFSAVLPEARIIAVEPDPGNAELARRNTADRPVTVLEAAIGGSSGRVSVSGKGAWAKRTTRDETGKVQVVTVAEALAEVPDGELLVVKIDIEGFESDLFTGRDDWIDEAAVLFIEPHDWMLAGRGSSFGFQRAMGARDWELVISGENLVYFRPGPTPA